MVELYERVNEYSAVSIRLASPDDIRQWSCGEVKKPETINYRTYRAEKDGLFCEKIFGPERNWECFCGKYKGIKHKGITCDRCGVLVEHSRVRRKRMGHITLACPIVHIWFFKSTPSRLGGLLGMTTTSLEKVIYYQSYVVTDAGNAGDLKKFDLLSEDEYRRRKEAGESFDAKMGGEAVKELLQSLDLVKLSAELRDQLRKTRSKQKAKDLIRQLKVVEALRDSVNKPEWMVLEIIPVIPPDLRPLVLLDSGNFATSDLNDLYRRIINRNNRLKKLMDLNAPEVIIRNEKRMLQQAVDALIDNNRCRRPVLGSSNRPLKSLTDMIKGKQGRFRDNLLGKRADYSARSVIVVGPELKLHQCGMPKKIALELYQPFIIRNLKDLGYADTIKSAKKMLERKEEIVWDILEDVVHKHPVLLNRAPTLHRMGIQAFEPALIEGNAIRIHPLVCEGFNADFDGDQMAVHLPLSVEAQVEASVLMLSTNNVFSPSHGNPLIAPSQDIVLGVYYLTVGCPGEKGEGMRFYGPEEVFAAHAEKKIAMHAAVEVYLGDEREVITKEGRVAPKNGMFTTTAGRIIFNDILPKKMPFYNHALDKKGISKVIRECYKRIGHEATIKLLDGLKELGFKEATKAGLTFSVDDLKMPPSKTRILDETQAEVDKIESFYRKGVITEGERYNQIIDLWTHATETIGEEMMKELEADKKDGKPYLNPIFLMAASGARGSMQQLRQLAGVRGLMAKPSGKIIEVPIKANFREGLKVLEYFSSTHGARKGLADTALKTADSGYLTRKLADVAQNVIVTEEDCGTLQGVTKGVIYKGDKIEVSLARNIFGRVARDPIVDIRSDEIIVKENDLITEEKAARIEALGIDKIRVRSPLTCETKRGICRACYGMDLSTGELVEKGLAVGIIGAQSIGEPGTQLTMRTFHYGGTASRSVEESELRARKAGKIEWHDLSVVENEAGETVLLKRSGEIRIVDPKGREIERYALTGGETGIEVGAQIKVKDGQHVRERQLLVKWDPHVIPILADIGGRVRFEDIVEEVTVRTEVDQPTKVRRKVIMEHKGDLHPQVLIEDDNGKILGVYPIPEKAHLEVSEGDVALAGQALAKTPKQIIGSQDITGGLPRVTELFEARKPRDPAIISEIDGVVELGEKKRGKRTIIVRNESGMTREHVVPLGKHVKVHRDDRVKAGDALVDGFLVLQDMLRISGAERVQNYLLDEIQNVYRAQNVGINDKHVEIIIAQMLRRVKVENEGDTNYLRGSVVDRFDFQAKNDEMKKQKKKPATAEAVLLGITRAALQSESFLAAASFQETTRVLTEAAISGKRDELRGLKANVILGHLIPAGTGFKGYLGLGIDMKQVDATTAGLLPSAEEKPAEEPEENEETES